MGGNSGGIIIRRKTAETASTSAVLDNCDQAKRGKLENILQKDVASWTVHEFRFVHHRIEEAHDNLC